MNKTGLWACRLHAASSWKTRLTDNQKSPFSTYQTLPPKFFGANFDPKHVYKTVNKKSRMAVDMETGTRDNLCVSCHILDKIKDHWQPTNLHHITTPHTTKSPENRLISIHLLTPIWWKKKACIFSKSTNFFFFFFK